MHHEQVNELRLAPWRRLGFIPRAPHSILTCENSQTEQLLYARSYCCHSENSIPLRPCRYFILARHEYKVESAGNAGKSCECDQQKYYPMSQPYLFWLAITKHVRTLSHVAFLFFLELFTSSTEYSNFIGGSVAEMSFFASPTPATLTCVSRTAYLWPVA